MNTRLPFNVPQNLQKPWLQDKPIPGQQFVEKLCTKEQLAILLELSQSYISKLMAEEGLPYVKIGRAVRFRESEVLVWLQKRSKP